jgi:hypothetical protein
VWRSLVRELAASRQKAATSPPGPGAQARTAGPGSRKAPGLVIQIIKRVPVAAGLVGGSANAAATLVAGHHP